MKIITALFIITMFLGCSEPETSDVYFFPTIHFYHTVNEKYSFDSLKAIIRRIDPDVIAVEIRPEDIDKDSAYLKKSYPHEMRMMKYWFPDKKMAGIDWLAKEIENKPIPADFWIKKSDIKRLQNELSRDSIMIQHLSECTSRNDERDSLLRTQSLNELLAGKDSEIASQQYDCYQKKMKNTKYQKLANFYVTRNDKILENIKKLIKENKGKRIVILTGVDHYVALKNKFKHH